ncbi:MAG: TlpA disulfide reductase family protein, partial [Gemmataceae bacterium]
MKAVLRIFMMALALSGFSACQPAALPPPTDADGSGRGLKEGDTAPLIVAEYWLNGPEMPRFTPERVTVLEFWATWCGPCLAHMKHLNELSQKYKPQGLDVIAVTNIDERGNTLDAVKKMLAGRLNGMTFPFAVSTTEKNAINYLMTGADSRPLPTSVVIGKDGKVAFIGTPDDLDEVLPQVLSGSWKLPDSLQERRKIQAELDDILAKIPQAAE